MEAADSMLDFTMSLAFESFNYQNLSDPLGNPLGLIRQGAQLARQVLG